MPTGLFYFNFLDQSISNIRGVRLVYIITMSIEFSVFNTNRMQHVDMMFASLLKKRTMK